jgi:hypothetical protein
MGGRALEGSTVLDYETGGVAIADSSQGLAVQTWRGRLLSDTTTLTTRSIHTYTGMVHIVLDVPDSPTISPFVVSSASGIKAFSFTFDQLMRPVVSFIQDNHAKLYWYDSSVEAFVVTDFGSGVTSPKVTLDDKRATQVSSSDVIFAYVENSNLYFRAQRDRFTVPYLLRIGIAALLKVGMTANYRLKFQCDAL